MEVDYSVVNKIDIKDFENTFGIPKDYDPKIYIDIYTWEEQSKIPERGPIDMQLHQMLKRSGEDLLVNDEYTEKLSPVIEDYLE